MINAQIRNSIWDERMNAERLSRYYNHLAVRYARNNTIYLWFIIFSAGGTATSLLEIIPSEVATVINIIFVCLSIFIVAKSPFSKAANAMSISSSCNYCLSEWRMLWDTLYKYDDESAIIMLRELRHKMDSITEKGKELEYNEKLNMKCFNEVHNAFG